MRGVTHIQRGRLAPAYRHFGSATSRTRTHDATRDDTTQEEQQLETPPTRLLTSEGCRKDSRPGARTVGGARAGTETQELRTRR
jgi:hypothetical protein